MLVEQKTEVSIDTVDEDFDSYDRYHGLKVDLSRDSLLTPFGKSTLDGRYVLPGEDYQAIFARVAKAGSSNHAHAQRLYDYISKMWFMPATPVLTNMGAGRGLPISCFLNTSDDTMEGIIETWNENTRLGSLGGGTGTYWGNIRSLGEKVGVTGKSSGVIPFLYVQNSLSLAISQGGIRRANTAMYMPVWHPEIEEFVEGRKPTGGDPKRKFIDSHIGVVVTDEFMVAVEKDYQYDLKSPKTGEVIRSISARSLWIRILTQRIEQGEPYILNIDTVNRAMPGFQKKLGLSVKSSNLCVAGDTKLLTDHGYVNIADVAGTYQTIWNGVEWSRVPVAQTSEGAVLRKIVFSNGVELWATDEHKFYVQNKYGKPSVEVRAVDLQPGDKLEKWSLPVIEGGDDWVNPYLNGFFTADGTTHKSKCILWLYGEKMKLLPEFIALGGRQAGEYNEKEDRIGVTFPLSELRDKYSVPLNGSLQTKLEWLAGYLDGDGSVTRNGECETIQYTSINLEFMHYVRRLLSTLGIQVSLSVSREEGYRTLPNGDHGDAEFWCQTTYRSCITSNDVKKLLDLGLRTRRLQFGVHVPNRDASRFITVISNGEDFKYGPTYCVNEPLRHRVVFDGIETGNCAEITLPTGPDHLGNWRTAVCCLSSLNLNYWDEFKDDDQFYEDVMLFLDNVLQTFIDTAPDSISRARYSAMRERSIGLGVMGFHDFLQTRMIPWESTRALAWNKKIFETIKKQADRVSVKLAYELGACPDAIDAGVMERFASKIAIAPTASISIIAGNASPGIDPISTNAFLQKTMVGSYTVKNIALEKLLESKGLNTEEVWSLIKTNKGSVQDFDFLSDEEKAVFKTAFELDMTWVIRHAAGRAPFICQSQSVNVFLPADVHKRDLHNIHMMAWKMGVKSLYYCRSMSIQRADAPSRKAEVAIMDIPVTQENKYETCEACQ